MVQGVWHQINAIGHARTQANTKDAAVPFLQEEDASTLQLDEVITQHERYS